MDYLLYAGDKPIKDRFVQSDIKIISHNELTTANIKELNKAKGLVILCESTDEIDGDKISHLSLFEIHVARKLRLDGLSIPILFISFLSVKSLMDISSLSILIKAIGHDFVRLPASAENIISSLKKINPLTETELRDVQLFSCKPEGIIRSKTHQIPVVIDKFKKNEISGAVAKSELITCIKEIFDVFKLSPSDIISDFNGKFQSITLENIQQACDFIKAQGDTLILNNISPEDLFEFKSDKSRPWKLLMLDDELDQNSEIVKLIKSKGIEVICKTNAEDALQVLTDDDKLRGKIAVILCDYRLYETKNGIKEFQQKTQGYTFLQQVGNLFQTKVISAVVYSGMPRQFLLETFKTYKIRTEIYSKIDFGEGNKQGINYLVSRIAEIGDANYDAQLALPLSNAGWESHLHKWYIYYRSQPDYEYREREISDYCSNWINEFKLGKNPPTPVGKGEQIPQDDKKEADRLARFESIYKARRIAQYLYLYYEHRHTGDWEKTSFDRVFEAIKPASRKADSVNSRKRFLSVILGLSLTEFPFGATIEELNWFHYDMGIEVLNSYRGYRERMNKTEEFTSELITSNKFLKESLSKENFRITAPAESSRTKEVSDFVEFNSSTFKPYLYDKMDIGVVLYWLRKQFEDRSRDDINSYFGFSDQLSNIWKWIQKQND